MRSPAITMPPTRPRTCCFEAVLRLRQAEQDTGRHVPVVALTANAMPGDQERCLAAGMDGYLSKPMRLQDLERALARWLDARLAG